MYKDKDVGILYHMNAEENVRGHVLCSNSLTSAIQKHPRSRRISKWHFSIFSDVAAWEFYCWQTDYQNSVGFKSWRRIILADVGTLIQLPLLEAVDLEVHVIVGESDDDDRE